MTLDEIDAMDKTEFVEQIGWVYEHSPWVAERAAEDKTVPVFRPPVRCHERTCEGRDAGRAAGVALRASRPRNPRPREPELRKRAGRSGA